MAGNSELISSGFVTIHYDGVELGNHHMDLDAFIKSIEGFVTLFRTIAQEIGIEEKINLEILPLENGGLKAKIFCYLTTAATLTIAQNFGNRIIDDLRLYDRVGIPHVVKYANQFFDRKKNVSDYKDIEQLTMGLDLIGTRIMLNKEIHSAAAQFSDVLTNAADTIEITSNVDNHIEVIQKRELPLFQNPFVDTEIEENVYNEEKVLRLEGIRYSSNEWIFYEKDSKGNWDRENTLRAIVLDQVLLSLGRDNSLNVLQEKDLYCTVRCREITKAGNKKKTIERSIIRCRLTPESLF